MVAIGKAKRVGNHPTHFTMRTNFAISFPRRGLQKFEDHGKCAEGENDNWTELNGHA